MRKSASQKAAHAVADRTEPRLSRAVRTAVERMRASVSINDLAMALHAKDVKRALALLSPAVVKDALLPAGTIVKEAVMRGGRLGAEQVNAAIKGKA